jgi:hypothetical protein
MIGNFHGSVNGPSSGAIHEIGMRISLNE